LIYSKTNQQSNQQQPAAASDQRPATNDQTHRIMYSLRTKPTQFTKGKTEETLCDLTKRYLLNTSSEFHLIDIVVTNKNLAETEQWKIRAGDTFKTCDNINIDILSSKSVNKNMSDYIMKIIKAKTKDDLPNILIVCFHQKRIKDIIDLVETFGKTSFVLNDTKIKFHISLDEPDANLGPAKFLIEGLREYVDRKLIVGILFITATPIDTFWKMLSESGISTLLNINRDAVNNYEEDLEKYRAFEDHPITEHNNDTNNPLEYIKDLFEKKIIKEDERKIIFSPGHRCKVNEGVGSHNEIIKFFNSKGYCVFCMNGEFKGFIYPDNIRVDLQKFKSENNINGELRDCLIRWNELNPNMNLAITGYLVIERGITFNTEGFCFTDMIFSNYHLSSLNKLIQLVGRGTGGKKYVKLINVFCTSLVKKTTVDFYKKLNEICLLNPTHFNKTDFTETTKTIPVKLTIEDQDLLNNIVELNTKKTKTKNIEIDKLLKDGVRDNKITVEDRNNIRKFDINTRVLNGVRMYKDGDKITVRRFKSYSDAFDKYTTIAQTCNETQYNIDFAKDEYIHDDFTHQTNVLWVTYRF
jgi:hypothetical protein